MATASLSTPISSRVELLPLTFPERCRVNRAAYHHMAETGLIDPGAKVELLNGEIVPMSPIGYPHGSVVDDLTDFFADRKRGRFRLRVQGPQETSEYSEPEPDLQLIRIREDRYRTGHPTPEDVLLAVEVAESSLAKDTGPKMRIYAAAGIVEYWVVDLVNRQLLVHTEPDKEAALYNSVVTHSDTATVAPGVADDCGLDLAWLFGPKQPVSPEA